VQKEDRAYHSRKPIVDDTTSTHDSMAACQDEKIYWMCTMVAKNMLLMLQL
jgi:hypothetical protein